MDKEKQLEKLHEALLEILTEFDRICKKNNIQYFLDSGTALGAVRHGGFIPWDDDVDVGMMRRDYEKFLRVAPSELKENIVLQERLNDPLYFKHHAKLRMLNTYFPESYTSKLKYQGIFIDIFPFDFVSDSSFFRKIDFFLVKYFRNRTYLRRFKDARKTAYRKFLGFFLDLISEQQWERIYQWVTSHRKKGDFTTCYEYMVCQKKLKLFHTEWMNDSTEIDFKGKKFQIMKGYDFYLKQMYQDYMQLPPEDKRVYHCEDSIIFDISGHGR